MGLTHWNKIINIYFLDKDGNQTKDYILCPRSGRKPEIEIVGTFYPSTSGGSLPAFTITITNLYLNLLDFQYPKIKVEAGYSGNLVSFKGSIISIFQESPGPDGKTVICCYLGTVENWLNAYVSVDLEPNTPFIQAVTEITKPLGFRGAPSIPSALQSLVLPAPFVDNGMVSDVLTRLFDLFPEYEIQAVEDNNQVCIYSMGKIQTSVKTVNIDYLSSPPQKNPGGDDGAYYTAFTAPWNPAVMPGIKATFPAWKYIKYFNLVNVNAETNAIIVQFVQLHFSTIGSVNQMQVEGRGVIA